nr:14847_t:CDS:2 [Entrophospora candida]
MSDDNNNNLSWVLYGIGDIKLENRKRIEPKPNEVEVSIKATGICGSDVHYWSHGHIGNWIVKEPMVLGHESCGKVTKVGKDCKILKVGDSVAIEPGVPCHTCEFCKKGSYNLCKDMKFAATPPYDGTLCQYYCTAEDFCVKLIENDENVNLEEAAALIEPLSVGVHACKQADLRVGQSVIIFGAGPVGLLTAAVAKASGSVKITMFDINQNRLNFAKNYIANQTILIDDNNIKNGNNIDYWKKYSKDLVDFGGVEQADVVFECSGAETSIQTGIFMTKSGGTFVQVGMGNDKVTIPITDIGVREITIKGTFRYCNTYKKAIDMVTAGLIDLKPLITHRFKFEDALKAFEIVKDGKYGNENELAFGNMPRSRYENILYS